MARFFYSCLFYIAIPFALLRLLKRSLKEPGYRKAIAERFGFFRSAEPGKMVWIHAVSAGEAIAAAPLVKRLLDQGYPCLVTNMTPTGRERVDVLLGAEVENCYAPYDLPGSIDRFLNYNKPRALITIDTELWPNMIDGCARREIPTLLVNGRLSSRSARGYQKIHPLALPMLQSLDLLAVQTAQHEERFISLGVDAARVHVTGSIKFDAVLGDGYADRLARSEKLVAGRPIVLGASTHDGEDSALVALLPALQQKVPDILLVLAPRHTHRCGQVRRACESAGQRVVNFSETKSLSSEDQVLLVDVMGELDALFELSSVAFIGGSLVPVGGHNLLEAVRARTPVIMGSHLDNIDDIAQQFIDNRAMVVVNNETELHEAVTNLIGDAEEAERIVFAADKVMQANTGALDSVETMVTRFLVND